MILFSNNSKAQIQYGFENDREQSWGWKRGARYSLCGTPLGTCLESALHMVSGKIPGASHQIGGQRKHPHMSTPRETPFWDEKSSTIVWRKATGKTTQRQRGAPYSQKHHQRRIIDVMQPSITMACIRSHATAFPAPRVVVASTKRDRERRHHPSQPSRAAFGFFRLASDQTQFG